MNQRKLLVLDVDETLVHGTEQRLEREPDFTVDEIFAYRRPHLTHFLTTVATVYDLAIWSAGSPAWIKPVIARIMPAHVAPAFLWTRERCALRLDQETFEHYWLKNLQKLKRSKGYDLRHVLVVDDDARTARKNYGNAIYVTPYNGETEDDELLLLASYLLDLHGSENFRTIEKRGWKQRLLEAKQ